MELSREDIERIADAVVDEVMARMEEGRLMLHSVPYIEGSPGIIVDEVAAKATPCTCYGPICFSKGIIGALSESQRTWACNPKIEKESLGMERRLERWRQAVDVCKAEIEQYPKGEKLEPWLSCMGRELPKRGIEI